MRFFPASSIISLIVTMANVIAGPMVPPAPGDWLPKGLPVRLRLIHTLCVEIYCPRNFCVRLCFHLERRPVERQTQHFTSHTVWHCLVHFFLTRLRTETLSRRFIRTWRDSTLDALRMESVSIPGHACDADGAEWRALAIPWNLIAANETKVSLYHADHPHLQIERNNLP